MGEDSRGPPLSRRVPGETDKDRPKTVARITPRALPEALLRRMQAAVDAAPERAAAQQQAARPERPAALPRRAPGASGGPKPPAHVARPMLSASWAARIAEPEAMTQPIPIISGSASSDMLSPAVEEVSAQPALAVQPVVAEPEPVAVQPETAVVAEPELTVQPVTVQPETAAVAEPELTVQPVTVQPEPAAVDRQLAEETPADHRAAAASRAAAERLGQRQASMPIPPASRRHRMAGMVVAVLILVAGPLAFAMSRHTTTAPGGGGAGASGAGRAPSNLAAAWAADQVSRAATLSCDPAMCRVLKAHGVPASDLLEFRRGAADLLRSDVTVATAAVRDQFGSRLSSVYAPALIASFGSGKMRIDFRAVAPHGAAAYWSALRADLRDRKESGAQLLRSNRIVVSNAAGTQLSAGQVDSRLLITIAQMAALHPLDIVAFGDPSPGGSTASPLRSAELAIANEASPAGKSAYMRSMLAFLRGPGDLYPAASIGTARLAGGLQVIRIEFAAPSPLGLVSPNAP
jgi:hypothetical protein